MDNRMHGRFTPKLLAAVALLSLCANVMAARAQSSMPLVLAPADLPPSRALPVFGQKIVYYDLGSGPVVVLVHGFGSQAVFDWGQVILPLAEHHRVLALDQIGFGGSDKPYVDYSIQTFVDFLGEFLRTLKVDHFTLAGESLGGWIATNYALQALSPANSGRYALPRPERLILEDAAGHRPVGSAAPLPLAGSLQEAGGVAFIFYDKTRITPEFIRWNFALKLKANDGATERLFLANSKTVATEVVAGKLAGISIPTLVVWGGNDPIVPLADGRDFADKIPGARLVVIPHCGHAPSIERPAEFLAAIQPFLP